MTRKKIYIVTLGARYMFTNAGTFLQHWALRKTVSEMGYLPARVSGKIDYNHIAVNNVLWCKSLIKQFVRVVLHCLNVGQFVKDVSCNVYSLRDYVQAKRFRKDFIKHVGACIEDTSSQADALILGGDQVFCVSGMKRTLGLSASKSISYAASTDWKKESNNDEWRDTVMNIITPFSSVGVREFAGVETLKHLGVSATRVADPVMLMTPENLKDLAGAKPIFKKPTLFAYLLNIPNEAGLHVNTLVSIADNLGTTLRMHGIQGAQLFIPNKYYLHLGPTEFVRAIMDAEYFVTNSYHGTMLALMFHKPFVCVMQEKADVVTQNVRQQELLELVGLQHRRISMGELEHKGLPLINEPIDWSSVDEKIDNLRVFSLEWLKNALKH